MCKSTFQKIRLQNIKKMMHKHPLFPVAFRFVFFLKRETFGVFNSYKFVI